MANSPKQAEDQKQADKGRKTAQAGQFLTNDARKPPSFGPANPRRG